MLHEIDPSLQPIESKYKSGCHERWSATEPFGLCISGSPKSLDSSPCLLNILTEPSLQETARRDAALFLDHAAHLISSLTSICVLDIKDAILSSTGNTGNTRGEGGDLPLQSEEKGEPSGLRGILSRFESLSPTGRWPSATKVHVSSAPSALSPAGLAVCC